MPKNYMNLFSKLFESYITYGITVWGSIPNKNWIHFPMHKRRPWESCLVTGKHFSISLGLCVFELDHILNKAFLLNFMSKDIVNHFLLIKNNLYLYRHCPNETFTILKFRSPIVVHNLYQLSTCGQKYFYLYSATSVMYKCYIQFYCYMEQYKTYV